MKIYSFAKEQKANIFLVLYLSALLLLSRDTLITSSVLGFYVSQALSLILILFCCFLFLYIQKKHIGEIFYDRRLSLIFFISLLLLVPMVIKSDWQLMYFSVLVCPFFAVFLTFFTDIKPVAHWYVIAMTLLGAYSLVCLYIIKPIFIESGIASAVIATNSGGYSFYNFGLSFALDTPNYFRNFGIFREPGVYQFFIILALYLNNYFSKWSKSWMLWYSNLILSLTMISTFSTSGLIELFLLAIIVFIDKKLYKDKTKLIVLIALCGVSIATLVYIFSTKGLLYWTLSSMFDKLFSLTDSSSARIESIFSNIKRFLTNPFFGSTIQNVLYSVPHNTSSTTILYAILGFFGGSFSVVTWLIFLWDKKRNFTLNILLLLTMFFSFNTQNLTTNLFFWLFPTMIFAQRFSQYFPWFKNSRKNISKKSTLKGQKVLFVTNIPAPYRMIFFNQLGKHCDLTVVFESPVAQWRAKEWHSETASSFKAIFLSEEIATGRTRFFPQIISIINQGYDKVILGGFSSPTLILAIIYMRLQHIRFYIEIDGGIIHADSKPKYLFKKFLISSASGWISSGYYPTKFLCKYGAKEKQTHLYPFSSLECKDILEAPLSENEKQELRGELGMSEKKIVLSVGRFIPLKGFDILIQAASKIPSDVGVYFVGGEPTAEYQRLKKELNLKNVHFVGFKSKEELRKYYLAADLFAFPTRSDVWGLVINEAMACGLPIVSTDQCIAGLELIEDGVNGFVVPVDNANLLAQKISAVLSGNLYEMGLASLQKIRPYTIENMVNKHVEILKEHEE